MNNAFKTCASHCMESIPQLENKSSTIPPPPSWEQQPIPSTKAPSITYCPFFFSPFCFVNHRSSRAQARERILFRADSQSGQVVSGCVLVLPRTENKGGWGPWASA